MEFRNMNKLLLSGAICATSLFFSMASQAAPFDFSGPNGIAGTTLTDGGVTASGFYYSGTWIATNLYVRGDGPADNGLGVCSEGQSACDSGGGDVNELSNQLNYEVILLDKGDMVTSWTSLWVSSLDGSEVGTVYWGNTDDIDALLGSGNMFSYDSTDFGSDVWGDILTLSAATGFNAMAQYVLFTPGESIITNGVVGPTDVCATVAYCFPTDGNNDYLVWKGTVVPVPAAVWLFGSGLLGLVGIARRKKAA